jgi:hypothetical protein
VDIDDDVEDHGGNSFEYKMKEMEMQSKYMQNIRMPN